MNLSASSYNLLFVDDDVEVLNVNCLYFQELGYHVASASDASQALHQLLSFHPHCIILDVMMPGIDGFSAFSEIRKKTNASVIFLTGRDSVDDKVRGLLLGADDYIVKPYSLRELEARIQVAIRQNQNSLLQNQTHDQNILDFSPLKINLLTHKVTYQSEEINLSNKEYDFLQLLSQNPGKTFSFEEIGTCLWGTYLDTDRKTIMVTASRLRKKLSGYPGIENLIESVWSKGYKFNR